MRQIYTILIGVILCAFASFKAKNTSTKTIAKAISQDKRYFQEVFSEITFNTYTYGKNTSQAKKEVDLQLDVYQPKGDSLSKRPLIIFVHGGGFKIGDKTHIKRLGFPQRLAKSGFVVASIDYRLIDVPENPMSIATAVLNATEDTRAAIRFFKKDAANKNNFKIDPEQIILGGYSAGAITTLFTAYLNSQQKVNTFFPPFSDYVKNNGGIEGNSGNLGYSSAIKGIFNIAGGISNIELMDQSINFIYSLHGTKDTAVSLKESPQLKGSKLVHEKALQLGIKSKLNTPEFGHDILETCSTCLVDLQHFLAEQINQ